MASIFSGSNLLSAQVSNDAHALRACIEDRRPDILAAFSELTAGEQEQMAIDGWTIGVRALMTAHTQAEQAKFADIGKALLEDVDGKLRGYVTEQERAISQALARYFDPKDGQLADRLRALLDDQGALAARLQQFVGPERSVLSETLARQLGENSPLLRKLSPTESDGVIAVLQTKVREALEQHRVEVARALDPLQKDGAIARFLGELRKELESADEDRDAQLERIVETLDANDEGSPLSRLMRETQSAHESLRRALNPMIPDSPLGTVKRALEELLQDRLTQQAERFEQLCLSHDEFQKEVRDAVGRIEGRREEAARNPRGGDDFEGLVAQFVSRFVPADLCTVEITGRTVGLRPHCKVGDLVVRFTEESAFAGCGIVVEAKRDASYTVLKAREELGTARANRGADVGLFVMARSHAPEAFPAFVRYGSNLLVVWDSEDPASDGVLQGAIVAALGLAQRKKSDVDPGDLNALADVEQRLIKELERLSKIEDSANAIRRQVENIAEQVAGGRKQLTRLVDNAKATLRALKVELRDEEAEEASPIVVPRTSSENSPESDQGNDRAAE